MYQALRTPDSTYVTIRHLRYHVREWRGPAPDLGLGAGATPAAASPMPPLILMHGWMDVGASFQFVVDALSDAFVAGRRIIAPDWRGYGLTQGPVCDNYWFPDYLADLDLLIDHYAPHQPVDLLGHSMGGNVVMLYAGVRPERIRRLINLEGFGLPASRPAQAPGRFAQWMDQVKQLHNGELTLNTYADAAGVAERLMKTNPRLGADKAAWLAHHWAAPKAQADGRVRWEILGDPAHKIVNAQLYRVDEVQEHYQRITAPVLAVEAASDSLTQWWNGRFTLAEYHERLRAVPRISTAVVQDAGHMLHHDQPQALARLIEDFVLSTA
jgi:pimeloyl-ACP methyl ester carboxylesterase